MVTLQMENRMKENGYAIAPGIFSSDEVNSIISNIEQFAPDNYSFGRNAQMYAIRQFFKEIPTCLPLICTPAFVRLVNELLGDDYRIIKSIYFDKPHGSNWFVSYHQDLTISVTEKTNVPGFHSWTVKHNQHSVQPPVNVLENIVTFRIHLDDTNENNGALRILPGTHKKGILRPENVCQKEESEIICIVPRGGVMIMHPLLMHSSSRTVNEQPRRVIHIELSNQVLPGGLQWSENFMPNHTA